MINIKVIGSSSKGNAYLLDDGYTKILLECGIAWRKIQVALKFKTSEIAACIASHEHADHLKAAKDVIKSGINLYCSKGTAEAVGLNGHRVFHVKDKQIFTVGSWTIMPFDCVHDAAEPMGYLLANSAGEKLLFLTDSSYCKYRFKGLTHLMLEANFSNDLLERNIEAGIVEHSRRTRLLESHFSLDRVKDLLRANDISCLKSIHLMHLSDDNSDEEQFKREIQQLTGVPVTIC